MYAIAPTSGSWRGKNVEIVRPALLGTEPGKTKKMVGFLVPKLLTYPKRPGYFIEFYPEPKIPHPPPSGPNFNEAVGFEISR
jgi:hypothetical protein